MKGYIQEIKNKILDNVIYPIVVPVVVAAAIGIAGCAPIYRNFPSPKSVTSGDFQVNPDARGVSVKYLEKILEGACDIVHYDEQMRTCTGRIEHIIICEKKIPGEEKFEVKWAINLDDICRVYVKENYKNSWITKPLDWVTGDDLKIWTNSFHVYETRLDDEVASKLGEIIQMFVTKNVIAGRCGDYYRWVGEKFTINHHKTPWELKEGGNRYVLVLPYSPAELKRRQKRLTSFFAQKNKEFLDEVKSFEPTKNTRLEKGKIIVGFQTPSGMIKKKLNIVYFK